MVFAIQVARFRGELCSTLLAESVPIHYCFWNRSPQEPVFESAMKKVMKMSHTKLLISTLALIAILGTGFAPTSSQWRPTVTPEQLAERALADSLLTVYGQVYHTALTESPEAVVETMDPLGRSQLRETVRSLEYESVASYIEKQVTSWPNADTLAVHRVDRSNDWVRLTLTGAPRPGFGDDWTRYTMVLYRANSDGYRVAAITSFETETRDRYGYQVNLQEMELPELFRFPKVL